MSHAESARRSFKISLINYNDYDSIMSGDKLPRGIGVRRFFYPRKDVTPSDVSKFLRHSNEELDSLNKQDGQLVNITPGSTTMDITESHMSTHANQSTSNNHHG